MVSFRIVPFKPLVCTQEDYDVFNVWNHVLYVIAVMKPVVDLTVWVYHAFSGFIHLT